MQRPTLRNNSGRVPSACQRCRQQKLKCDIRRPCTLCIRANATCTTPVKPTTWKTHEAGRSAKKARRGNDSAEVSAAHGRPSEAVSSASSMYLDEAFQQHNTTSPDAAEVSAFSAPRHDVEDGTSQSSASDTSLGQRGGQTHATETNATRQGMLSALPAPDIATMLVNNYFDRIHWFVLVFHQSDFRLQAQQLYDETRTASQCRSVPTAFLGVYLAVCVLSLSYLDPSQTATLSRLGEETLLLQERLLRPLRRGLLDIAAEGSLEAVQTCPQLAWPVCGWALRIAQALKLHRRSSQQTVAVPDLDDLRQRAEESRKRCWWAVYEIETFCSMLYGYPLSINDDDCDIEPLHQYPVRSADPTWDAHERRVTGHATLLSYKVAIGRLSIIVRTALLKLYSLGGRSRPQKPARRTNTSDRMRTLVESVAVLDRKLDAWRLELPQQLHFDQMPAGAVAPCRDYLAGAAGSCSRACFHYLFPLQTLSLKLAFENARILIHRPLLKYRLALPDSHQANAPPPPDCADLCQASVRACQTAALQISNICSLPLVHDTGATYAVAFVCLHLLTAAITLSILASLNTMSQTSHDCKMGLRRLMEMQSRLTGKSIVTLQGLTVSKKLMSLVLQKERDEMLNVPLLPDPPRVEIEARQEVAAASRASAGCNEHNAPEIGPSCASASMQRGQAQAVNMLVTQDPLVTPEDPYFGFYEDLATTQALFDFEQAFLESHSDPVTDGRVVAGSLGQQTNGAQDYSWIWSSNVDPALPWH
ncbi:hypothetical protein QR685DRAFT_571191 [Neurospora intermedia]|uniref:Zn(2)-C6 fungal-type domain-containing protein n=1 Tax=Neurospora intermedia TaxID=5142 RepID=A0ABR3DLB1_NEUIN